MFVILLGLFPNILWLPKDPGRVHAPPKGHMKCYLLLISLSAQIVVN